ncbi:MAG TPA: SEFIR domain-containing protein, partial [Pseudonocardiaceae bacterium]|nr:SEFIR domain-containing protein [Pseudonocardiaceae bacterium]
MTDMTLERWLTELATDATPTAGLVSLDSALVEELAGVLLVDPRELTFTVSCLADVHAGPAPAYAIRSGTWRIDLAPAVAQAVVLGAVVTTLLQHVGVAGLPVGVLSAIAVVLLRVQRVEITSSDLVVHTALLHRVSAAPHDLDTLYQALPPDVRAELSRAELADGMERLRQAGLAGWNGTGITIHPTDQPRRIRLVIRDLDIPSASPALATSPQKDTEPHMPTGPDLSANRSQTGGNTNPQREPTVFISYAHDSADHRLAVLTLAELLNRNGIEVILDQWAGADRKDWGAWALGHIISSDFVIIVASPDYQRVGDGVIATTNNPGAQSEAVVIRDQLHHDRPTWTRKLLPVVLPGHRIDEISSFLQPFSADHYVIDELTDAGIDDLLRTLTGQPSRVRPPRGGLPHLPPLPPVLSHSPMAAAAAEVGDHAPRWSVLPQPLDVTWRAALLNDGWGMQRAATLEVHVVPDGGDPLSASHLRRIAATLTSLGRRHGLFAETEGVSPWSDQTAVAATTDGFAGCGVAALRSGQCGAWRPLPKATIGYVLDETDVRDRVTALLALLAEMDIPRPTHVVPTLGIQPAASVWEGSVSDLNRSSVRMSLRQPTHIRLPADERLAWHEVVK